MAFFMLRQRVVMWYYEALSNEGCSIKPKILHALRGKCLYCGKTRLFRSWFVVNEGCKTCHYKFEREVGYFTGASWMVNYALGALSAMLVGAYMVWKHSDMPDLMLAAIPAIVGGFVTIVNIPLSRSLWMYIDHTFHPLQDDEKVYR